MRARITFTAFLLAVAASPAMAHEPLPATFTTEDGVAIVGHYWTPIDTSKPAPVVILLHMYRSNKEAWTPLIPALEHAGFAVMAIDLRGHGASTQPASMNLARRAQDRDATLFNAMTHDVTAALKWLEQRKDADLERVVLVGASVGCSVALASAARDERIDAVALMTPGKNYLGVDSMTDVQRYGKRPILILSTEEELDGGALPLASALDPSIRAKAAARASTKPENGTWLITAPSNSAVHLLIAQSTQAHGTRMFGKVTGVEKAIAAFCKDAVSAK